MNVKYIGFWPKFSGQSTNIFNKLLVYKYNLNDKSGDYIAICNGANERTYTCKHAKAIIYFSGEYLSDEHVYKLLESENVFVLTYNRITHPRFFRIQNIFCHSFYGYYSDKLQILPKQKKTRFCSFINNNCGNKYRINFVKQLHKYTHVDCAGKCLFNMPWDKPVAREIGIVNEIKICDFISNYKFHIAFENMSRDGYCTEKIWWGIIANTIPIYWGDGTIYTDFNKGSFLNRADFQTDKEFIEYIQYVDSNEQVYNEILTKRSYKYKISDVYDRLSTFLTDIYRLAHD